jgi:glycosyltransferase involved in cell wall biosynthesis
MRVLSILPFSPPAQAQGGAERQMHALHKGLITRGVEVHVLAEIREVGQVHQEVEGISVWGVPFPVLTSHPLRPGTLKIWQAWRQTLRLVRTRIPTPDLIQVTTFRQPALLGFWLARRLNVPWVTRLACSGSYGDFNFASGNWLTGSNLATLASSVSCVVALDEQTREEAIVHGVPSAKVRIIRNGLVLQRMPSGVRARPGTWPSPIAYVGRIAEQKRLDTLVDACSLLRRTLPEVPPILIAGDGQTRTSLEERARRLEVGDRCVFLGAVPGPEAVLERSGCFVNPSQSEGLPNAVLEAAAFGVPLILSDIPVHREIAGAVGMERFLFPVGDARALAERLKAFWSLSDREKRALSDRCRAYGLQYAPEVRDNAYYDLYRELLERRGAVSCPS